MSIFVIVMSRKPSIIWKTLKFPDYRGVSFSDRLKWMLDLDSTGQKTLNIISSIRIIPGVPKIKGRLFFMPCNYSNKENVEKKT